MGGDNSLLGLGLGTGAEDGCMTSLAAVTSMLRPRASVGGVGLVGVVGISSPSEALRVLSPSFLMVISELELDDFFLSLLHHFQSGWALK